jgi:hypothetical protein
MALSASEYQKVMNLCDEAVGRGLIENLTPENYLEALSLGISLDGDAAFTFNLSLLNAALIKLISEKN